MKISGHEEGKSIMITILSVTVVLFLTGSAGAQRTTREDILAILAKDGPTKGRDKAPVTIIEFSDFQCSFCRKFWQQTLPSLEKKYIETGKVKFVYRHFAILGRLSTAAAQAVECAHDQKKFWEYHDKLFSVAGSPLAFTAGKLKDYAKDLGLNSKTFDPCLESGKYLNKVEQETGIGSLLGATGTPTFLLNGMLLPGAQPFHVFEAAIEEELKKKSAPPTPKP